MTRTRTSTRTLRALAAVLVLLVALLASFGPLAAPAGAAEPAFTFVNDEQGLNDPGTNVSAQNDLTRMGRDDTQDGVLHVTWSWDKVDFSGGNTGNACALLDTDADGFVNFVVCVEIRDNGSGVAVQADDSPFVFSCNDARTDRCRQPTPITQVGDTDCVVSTAATDPFAGGEAYPNDTTATCSIDLSAPGFGGRTPVLVNVCSYPSAGNGGNNNPFDCIVTPGAGFLSIIKEADPDDDTEFVIGASAAANNSEQQWTFEGSGEVLLVPYQPTATLDLAETVPSGWQLDTATCLIGTTTTGSRTDRGVDDLEIRSGQETICTFTNSPAFVAPDLTVDKSANPTSVDEPGDDVTITIVVTNNAPPDLGDATLESLDDNVHGPLTTACVDSASDPIVGQTLPGGESLTCTFTATVSGDGGFVETDRVTATASGPGGSDTASDDAVVTVADVQPTVDLVKDVDPVSLDEPGGDFTYTLTINNTSVEPVTITALTDDNPLPAQCTGLIGLTVPAGDSLSCTYTVNLTAPGSYDNTASVTVADNETNEASDTDSETATVNDVPASIEVVKRAGTAADGEVYQIAENGGLVAFSVTVTNISATDAVTIDTLTDSVHGSLNGQGDCSVPQTIPAGDHYTCTFDAEVSGNAGHQETDVVTASGLDDDGIAVSANDDAVVEITDLPSEIEIVKTASPTSVDEPGGDVTYMFVVNNLSTADGVTIDSLTDNVYGDLNGQGDCSVPRTIAAGGSYSCSITVFVSGNAEDTHTNMAAASGLDDDGNPVSAQDDETVTITDLPSSISTTKTASPTSVPETGGDVTFTITVENTSAVDTVRITSVSDGVFGDVSATCGPALPADLQPGETVTCSFTELLSGDVGQVHTNAATASGQDDDGNPVEDEDQEDVPFEDVLPDISIVKTADPTSVTEPGGDVEFTIEVTNNSLEEATIGSLFDSDFDLATQCADAAGTVLASSNTYTCVFTETVVGNVGENHQNTATVVASDNEGNTDTESDSAGVAIDNANPSISLAKTPNQEQVFAPGEDVAFTVLIENTSESTDPVTVDSLMDSVHGDLDGQGDCAVPMTIASGGSYECTFTAFIDGDETDVVEASGVDDEGSAVSAADDASVEMINPSLVIEKSTNGFDADSAPGPEILEGADVMWTYTVTNDGDVDLEGVTVVDNQGVAVSCPRNTLSVGESMTCTALGISEPGQYANIGTATAVHIDSDGDDAQRSDGDPSHYFGAAPSVDITKTFADDDVVAGGDPSSFEIEVTNDGNVDLVDIEVFDDVDSRLDVTDVSSLDADCSASTGQIVECTIANLSVGQSVTITVDFVVAADVAEAPGVSNTANVENTYTDDVGNSTGVSDEDSDTIDILSGVDLSIAKEFDPERVAQGAEQSFAIVVRNDGPVDADGVQVTDIVPVVLDVVGVSVPSLPSSGNDCSASSGQDIDCTVDVPGNGEVTITVTYTVLPFLDGDPSYGTEDGSEFRFVFLNSDGTIRILEGSATGDVTLDGASVTAGRTKNDYNFDPPGDDPPFLLHLSCSDPFTDGWGSDGPDRGSDVNWQVAAYSIVRYKKGEFFRKCGDVVVPFDVPNTATATWTGPAGEVVISDEGSVRIGPGVSVERIRVNNRRLTVWLNNRTGDDQGIKSIDLTWPENPNGDLERVTMNGDRVFQGSIEPPSARLEPDGSGWELQPGENILRFDFDNRSDPSGYELVVTFDDDTVLEVTL